MIPKKMKKVGLDLVLMTLAGFLFHKQKIRCLQVLLWLRSSKKAISQEAVYTLWRGEWVRAGAGYKMTSCDLNTFVTSFLCCVLKNIMVKNNEFCFIVIAVVVYFDDSCKFWKRVGKRRKIHLVVFYLFYGKIDDA